MLFYANYLQTLWASPWNVEDCNCYKDKSFQDKQLNKKAFEMPM